MSSPASILPFDSTAGSETASCKTTTARPPAAICAKDFDAWFRPRFALHLRRDFARDEEAAVWYGVSVRTIANWREEVTKPSSAATGLYFLRFEDAISWFFQERGRG